MIVTQLCQAVTDLILQMPGWTGTMADLLAMLMPGWTGAVADLLAMLGQKNTITLLSAAASAVTQFLQLCVSVWATGKNTGQNVQVSRKTA